MVSPRIRRLQTEYAEMLDLNRRTSLIDITSSGAPPTRYNVRLYCQGIYLEGEYLKASRLHEFDINLDAKFPDYEPLIVWKTPIFHPNFRRPKVCTGDIWFPASSLAELCVNLCEMVQYKSFNIYDPLDFEAASWLYGYLQSDDAQIPIDSRPVLDLDFDLEPQQRGGDNGQ